MDFTSWAVTILYNPILKQFLSYALLTIAWARAADFNPVEATIPQIQAAVRRHQLTYEQLVRLYLRRIEQYDRGGPKLNSIRHLNPKAVELARDRDRHRAGKHGPLYGIPVLLKDNIDTADEPTTAGSVALANSTSPRDAFVTRKLRQAGAVIIGKANLTEFANYIANNMPAGYSSLGGYVLNPYNTAPAAKGDGRPELSPGGSSAGPGSAVAANLVTVAIGSETSGSILSPSNQNSIVGIKPTVGLISRTGVVPIAASQDTLGPMARTVTDAAILLGALTARDPDDQATDRGEVPTDYTEFLLRDGLKDARIGVPREGFWNNLKDDQKKILENAIAVIRAQGAEVMDVEIGSAKELNGFRSGVLRYEFKRDLNHYLGTLRPGFPIKTLADVIAFNKQANALKYGQALAEGSDATDLEAGKAAYLADRAKDLRLARDEGIDLTMRRHRLDALLFPSNFGAAMPAKAGYPSVIVPGGYLANGAPFGVTFTGLAWSEPTLIRLAYAFEQATHYRRPPASAP
jgi:amidase